MNPLIRPNQCSQCSGKAKYTCPRCSVRTCSLACVQAHKDLTSCSGIRDKAAYVSIKEFTNFNLLSDYRLMEEIGRVTDNAFRNKSIRRFELHNRNSLPGWLHRLRVEAKLRGTNLKIMPHVFTRRRENSTCYIQKLHKILWQIEWQFPHTGCSVCDKRVDEDSTLESLLSKFFDITSEKNNALKGPYKDCSMLDVKVLLRAEDKPGSQHSYYDMELDTTIKESLKKKTVVEFPVFLVVLKSHLDPYNIIKEKTERTVKGQSNTEVSPDASKTNQESSVVLTTECTTEDQSKTLVSPDVDIIIQESSVVQHTESTTEDRSKTEVSTDVAMTNPESSVALKT